MARTTADAVGKEEMKISPSMDIVWRLAANEMAAGEFKEVEPEHFCMALLKFAELSVKVPEDGCEQEELAIIVSGDAHLVREALQKCGIESKNARRALRGKLGKGDSPFKGGRIHRSVASRALFESAAKLAAESGNDTVTPLHLLTSLVQSPTPAIAQVVLSKTPVPPPPAALTLLEMNGRDLVRQAAEGGIKIEPGVEAQSKAVLQVLHEKDRRSILLVSDSDALRACVAAALAIAIAAKDAPQSLKARRLIDVSGNSLLEAPKGMRPSSVEAEAEMERMRQLLAEAASHPEVILLVPAVDTEPKQSHRGQWTALLRETLEKGKVQFICRVAPSLFTEHLRKDAVWKRQTQAVWLNKAAQGSVPREL